MKFEIGDRVTLKKGLYLIENSNPLDIEGFIFELYENGSYNSVTGIKYSLIVEWDNGMSNCYTVECLNPINKWSKITI